jgi:saccharopine dehydrogenase-like NADP-dependent oxidoreductase
MKITVLGGGMVGRVMAVDLARDFDVSCADLNPEVLKLLNSRYKIKGIHCDFSRPGEIRNAIQGADLVIGAVPGKLGFEVLKTVIESGKNMVDISFFPEDAFLLDELALKNDVTAIVDCGIAPGYCNMIAGYYYSRLSMDYYSCMVGGLPVKPVPPFNYKAPFSPADVIEEYVRPARMKENGAPVVKEALSDIELVEFAECGTLEAFNTDGLRTLLHTLKLTGTMKEKTLRYPGHAAQMKLLRDTGFFSNKKIKTARGEVSPLEVASALLFEHWKYDPGEEDFTIMKVVIRGEQHGIKKEISCTVYDRYHQPSATMSMARTTGYTCTAAARLLIEKKINRKGICPPEFSGENESCFKFVTDYLLRNGIHIRFDEKTL